METCSVTGANRYENRRGALSHIAPIPNQSYNNMQNAIGALLLRPPPMLLVWFWFQIYTNSEPLHGITINVFFGLYLCTFLFDSSSSSSSSFSLSTSCWCCFFYYVIWYVVHVTAYNTAYTDHGRLSDRHMKHLWDSVVVTFVRVFIYIINRSFFVLSDVDRKKDGAMGEQVIHIQNDQLAIDIRTTTEIWAVWNVALMCCSTQHTEIYFLLPPIHDRSRLQRLCVCVSLCGLVCACPSINNIIERSPKNVRAIKRATIQIARRRFYV